MILYRPMVSGDIPAGLSLCRTSGWNQTAEDWELFLELSPAGCCVAVDDEGQVRGTVATVRYEGRFSWIGMVLVDPGHQRRGIGIQLLRESLHILRDEETVKLDATPAGRHIYLQLDFADEYRISRMELQYAPALESDNTGTQLILPDDLPEILDFDREVFGADREPVLQSVLNRSPQYGWMSRDGDKINGLLFRKIGSPICAYRTRYRQEHGSRKSGCVRCAPKFIR